MQEDKELLTQLEELAELNQDLKSRLVKLEEEREYLGSLLDNIPDAIYFKDLKSQFVKVNKAWVEKSGAGCPEDMVGKTDFDIFTEEHARQAFADEQEIIKSATPLVGIEEKETWPNRPDTWVSTTKLPLYNSKGKIIGTFGLSRDITEIKQYRDALQKAKNELEIRVEERTTDLRNANTQLKTRIEQLNTLNDRVYNLSRLIHVDELYPVIIEDFLQRFPRAEASLTIHTKKGYTCVHATEGLNTNEGKIASEKSFSFFWEAQKKRCFIIEDWKNSENINQHVWPNVEDLPCFVAIPLPGDNTLSSFIQIFTTKEFISIFEQEKPLITTLAAHAAVCLSNAVRYKELGDKARLEGELNAARNIQRSFTPQFVPSINHVNLKGLYIPAFEVGGDYLDYFETDDGHWVIVIADVCGKGVPAALFMTILRSTFRAQARKESSAKNLLCTVNESMQLNIDNRSFVTALCLIIDKDGSSMTYANAGHPRLLKIDNNGEDPRKIECRGIAMGLLNNTSIFSDKIEEISIDLVPGDRYFIYTDGLTESFNEAKELYGMHRLNRVLSKTSSLNPEGILNNIIEDVNQHTKEVSFNHDDLTMLAIEVY